MKRFQQIAAVLLTLLIAVALFGNNFILDTVVQAAANEGVTEEEGDVDVPIVQTKTIRSISIKTKPTKLIYLQGEPLNLTGLVVRATYSDNTKGDVSDYQISGYDPGKSGEQTISVTLSGKTASFKVNVYPIGDANGDLIVNDADANTLMQYAAGWDIEVQPFPADVNGDSKVDGDDATLLLRYLAGWNVILG